MLQRLPIRINKSFVALLMVEALVIVFDIVSSWTCEAYASLPGTFVVGANMLYFIFFSVRGFVFFIFTCNILGIALDEMKLKTFIAQLPMIINILIIISSPWTKAVYYIDDNGYNRGNLYNSIIITFIIYLLLIGYCAIRYLDSLSKMREKGGIFLYLAILTAGIILRVSMPKVLLMDTFCVMAILCIDLIFMNPDFFIERRTEIFNTDGLKVFLDEMYAQKYTQICAFVICHYQEARDIYSANQMDNGISLIGAYLKRTFPEVLHFYNRTGRFIIIAKDNDHIETIIKTIEERFKSPWFGNDLELYLDVSFARVECNCENYNADSIVTVLSNALKRASNSPNETVIIDDDMFAATHETTAIKRSLENAIENDAVEIFLQPIVDARTFKLSGAESLARIRDEKGNIIPPGKFISLAEKNGRINQLGDQVFKKTCEFIRGNDIAAMGMQWINVNLSTAQFMKKDLAEVFERLVSQYGVSPNLIHLEITEAAIIDESIMKNQIQEIQKRGFVFALDDYGTGYSNASRLKHFPFTNVKIDMSLVWDYCAQPDKVLPMLIETLKSSGYTITAEGIETLEMANTMADIGCDYLQGWYFSQPIPTNDFSDKYR